MNDHNHKGMMWMMLLCCLVPIVLLLSCTAFFRSVGYGWIGVLLIGGFAAFRLIPNLFGTHNDPKPEDKEKDDKNSTNHKSCCH